MKTQTALIKYRSKLSETASYLLIAFGFILPISVALTNILAMLIVLLWLTKGNYQEDWQQVKRNPVVLAILGFVALHVIGLLWTADLQNGLYVLKKESILLLLPIFMLYIKRKHIKHYVNAFLIAMLISVILSFAIWLKIIPPFLDAWTGCPNPFMGHISYTPFLTISIYIVLYRVCFDNTYSWKSKAIYAAFAIIMSIGLFTTIGRAGQVMYFAMIGILIFQYFHKQSFMALAISLMSIAILFSLFYGLSTTFQSRVNEAVRDIKNYENNKNTNVGLRLAFTVNSFEIIKNNPFIGVGTGDFNVEYERVNARNTPDLPATSNPHNMYVLELVQFGILGLFSLLSILGAQFFQARKSENHLLKSMGIALPLLFAVIMLSDSYLRGHFTTMLFVFFSSFLYKDYEE